MKVKYLRLSKEERKKVNNKYFNTEKGKYIKKKIQISFICGVLCIMYGIYLLIDSILNKITFLNMFYSISIIVFGIILVFATHIIKIKKLNNYVVKNKK